MNTCNSPGDWTEANQRFLVAELARIKALLAGESSGEAGKIQNCREALETPAAIDLVSQRFGLNAFERDVLLLTAGVEMDTRLAALCASGSHQGSWATFGIALAVLPDAHWSALTPARPLRRWRMIEVENGATLAGARLRIDERILHFIAGIDGLDVRLRPLLRTVDLPEVLGASQMATADAIVTTLARRGDAPVPLIQIWGSDASGQRDVAACVASHVGLKLHAISAADIPAQPAELEAFATLWEREVVLSESALLIEAGDSNAANAGVRRLLESMRGLVMLATREAIAIGRDDRRFEVHKPDAADQLQLWQDTLGERSESVRRLAESGAAFHLSAQDIRQVAARLRADSGNVIELQRQYCRELACRRLEGLAQRIEPKAGWSDLVLPDTQMHALRQIASQVRHRATVYERWGFAARSTRGLGLAALFAGDSGTGKTMAAEVLALELGLDLFRVDLAAVVSKYIGETEKNLARIFDAAEDGGAILLFDEADALFGRRSEVKDSHDRYANIEVSYLLQRMESYRGLAILTTNQKAALDHAFQRRLRIIVQFPFPDTVERHQIWRGIFPQETPTTGLDPAKLARLQMSGGQIRNMAIDAAFQAAERGESVGMQHLLRAAHAEAAKRERPIADAEIRGWQ